MLCELGTDVVHHLHCPGRTLIGRGKSCDIQPESTSISKQHAAILSLLDHHTQETEWWIEDLGSRNGTSTKTNGVWATIPSNSQRKLLFGDLVKFGHSSSIYMFETEDNDGEDDLKESVLDENSEILQEREPLNYQPESLSNSMNGKRTQTRENLQGSNKLQFSIEYPSDQISNYPPISVQVGRMSGQFQSENVDKNSVSQNLTRTNGHPNLSDADLPDSSPLTSPLKGEGFLPPNEDDYDLPPPTYSDNEEIHYGSLEVLGVGMRDRDRDRDGRRNHPGNFSLPQRTQSMNFPQRNPRDLGGSLPNLNERHPPVHPLRSSSPLQFQTRNDMKTWSQQVIDQTPSPLALTQEEISQIQTSRDELADGIKMANKILGGVAPYEEWKKYASTVLSKTQPPEHQNQSQSIPHEPKTIISSTEKKISSEGPKFNIAISSDVLRSVKEEKSLDVQFTSVGILSKLKSNIIFLLEYEPISSSSSSSLFPVELFNNVLKNSLQIITDKLFLNDLILSLHHSLRDEKMNGTSLKDFIELKLIPRIQGLIAFNETIDLHTVMASNTPLPLEMGQLYQINKHICSNLLEDIEGILECLIQLKNTVLNENTQLSKYLLKATSTQFELQPKNSLEGISAEYSSDGELKIISSQPSPRQQRGSGESSIRNSGADKGRDRKQKKNESKSMKSRDKQLDQDVDNSQDYDDIRENYRSSRGSDKSIGRNRARYSNERDSDYESDRDYRPLENPIRESQKKEDISKCTEKNSIGISQALWEKLNADNNKESVNEMSMTPPVAELSKDSPASIHRPIDPIPKITVENIAIIPSLEEIRTRNFEQKTKSVLLIRKIKWKLANKGRNRYFYRWKFFTQLISRSALSVLKQKKELELEREEERLKKEKEFENLKQSYHSLMEEKEKELEKIKSLMTKKVKEVESKEDQESETQRKLKKELEEKEEEILSLKKKQEALADTKNQIENQFTKEIDNLVRRNSVLQESGQQIHIRNQQKILLLKVLSSLKERLFKRVKKSFSVWKRLTQLISSHQKKEMERKKQLKRVLRLGQQAPKMMVRKAFQKWERISRSNTQQKTFQIPSDTQTIHVLKAELLNLKEELLFLRQTDVTAAYLEAERALNREISSANLDLQQRLMTVEAKLLELATVPASERKELVRDVLLDRENEVSRLRRENRSLREQIHRLELSLKSPNDENSLSSAEETFRSPKTRKTKPRDQKRQRNKGEEEKEISRHKEDGEDEGFDSHYHQKSHRNEEIELSKQEAMQIVISELRKLQLTCQELEREKVYLGSQLFEETSRYQHQTMALRLSQQRLLEREGQYAKLQQSLIKKYGERETHQLLVSSDDTY